MLLQVNPIESQIGNRCNISDVRLRLLLNLGGAFSKNKRFTVFYSRKWTLFAALTYKERLAGMFQMAFEFLSILFSPPPPRSVDIAFTLPWLICYIFLHRNELYNCYGWRPLGKSCQKQFNWILARNIADLSTSAYHTADSRMTYSPMSKLF